MSLQRFLPRLAPAILLTAAITWAIGHRQGFDAPAIEAAIRNMGIWAPLAYMGLYAVATVLFLPGSILGLVGGALFGPVWGVVYALLGATVGATLAFLAARYVASDWVAAKAGGRVRQLIAGVEGEGWRFVAFVRLVPPAQLCPWPDANPAARLRAGLRDLHGTWHDRLHLSRLRQPRGYLLWRGSGPEGPARARTAGACGVPAARCSPVARQRAPGVAERA